MFCKSCESFKNKDFEEVFIFCYFYYYNINNAKKLIGNRKPKTFKVSQLKQFVDYPRSDKIEFFSVACSIDENHLDHVSDDPIILAYTPAGVLLDNKRCSFPIDGHHRLAKYIRDNKKTIKGHLLTEKETDSILKDYSK